MHQNQKQRLISRLDELSSPVQPEYVILRFSEVLADFSVGEFIRERGVPLWRRATPLGTSDDN